ncbi:MAG: hypothetical protein RL235_593, partial [Chlamydiota bacterium]
MQWIHRFQLFLFDFDGLLVNTEHLHYQAYCNMLSAEGFRLELSFQAYCQAAHASSTALREAIYASCPGLSPDWDRLYREKKRAYLELLGAGKVELMPGVEPLLKALAEANIRRVVVTHSPREQITLIRRQHTIFQTLPYWLTREDYDLPKPHPDGY